MQAGKVVYLDNNATTRVADEVVTEMLPFFTGLYGNPSSTHRFGGQLEGHVATARARVASLLGANPSEIVFTSGGTESNNAAIRGALQSYPERKGIVTTAVEHPAVGNLCRHLAEAGYSVSVIPVDRAGRLDLDRLRRAVNQDTAIVSVMWANNETGVMFPVEEAAALAHAQGAMFFHTDAVQAVGKIPIDLFRATDIDLLALSGHKLHAPKGVGVLYVRQGTRLAPFLVGGHQEGGRRAGTENVPGIVALGKACQLAQTRLQDERARISLLRGRLEAGLLEAIPGAMINGEGSMRLPNTLNIGFESVSGEAVVARLSERGICASSGSACNSGSLEPSPVLRAMGVPSSSANGAIRLSLSAYNTEEEIDYALRELPRAVADLRQASPSERQADACCRFR
ncbi:MAG: cysteine desulfurase NifS [Pseudomonadota bacterium]